MIRHTPSNQLSFKTSFEVALNANNRWVTFSQCIPWDSLANLYSQGFPHTGRAGKDPRPCYWSNDYQAQAAPQR